MTGPQWSRVVALIETLSNRPLDEAVQLLETSGEDRLVVEEVRQTLFSLNHGEDGAGCGEPEPVPLPRTGLRLGKYLVGERMGSGSYGEVYSGRDTILNRVVAMKFLPADTLLPKAAARALLSEAQAASALNHPNIITVYEALDTDSGPVIVMELVEGRTLREVLRDRIPESKARQYGLQIFEALAAAHANGIVHRDVKPENIMVRPDGYIKVLDFGLARQIPPVSSASANSRQTGMAGTLRYMSPEQCAGQSATTASDVYSAALVLSEMATGSHAFGAATPLETAMRIRNESPRLKTNGSLETIALKLLAKSPADRPTAAHAVQFLQGAGQRRWAMPAFIMLVATGIVLAVVALAANRLRSTQPPTPTAPLNIVNLTTLEGVAWGSTFSPDGRQIAFSWDGGSAKAPGIYSQPVSGGTPVRLSQASREDFFPVWSPDGTQIAFARRIPDSGRILVMVTPAIPGGPERRVAEILNDQGYPNVIAWHPDGKSILARDLDLTKSATVIVRLPLDGGPKTALTKPPDPGADGLPTPSPDGLWLAFFRLVETQGQVCLQSILNAAETKCFAASEGTALGMAWSADQHSLYLTGGGALSKLNIESGKWSKISDGSFNFLSGDRQGRQFAFSSSYSDWNIWNFPASGKGAQKWIGAAGEDSEPSYSPDGTQIVFRSARSGQLEIWVCGRDGSKPSQLTRFRNRTENPKWSPDGKWISFWGLRGNDRHARMYVVSSAKRENYSSGDDPYPVTPDTYSALDQTWSADGKSILFSGGLENVIWSIPAFVAPRSSPGEAVRFAKTGWWLDQHLSNDRKWIYFTRTYEDASLWRMPATGGDAAAERIPGTEGLVNHRYSDIVNDTLYFVDAKTPSKSVRALDLKSGQSRILFSAPGDLLLGPRGMAVSPDGNSILITKLDARTGEIKMIDNLP